MEAILVIQAGRSSYNWPSTDGDKSMGKVERIEAGIKALSEEELSEFRRWFLEFDAGAWDAKIEADAKTGRLDALMTEALDEFAAGKAREI